MRWKNEEYHNTIITSLGKLTETSSFAHCSNIWVAGVQNYTHFARWYIMCDNWFQVQRGGKKVSRGGSNRKILSGCTKNMKQWGISEGPLNSALAGRWSINFFLCYPTVLNETVLTVWHSHTQNNSPKQIKDKRLHLSLSSEWAGRLGWDCMDRH